MALNYKNEIELIRIRILKMQVSADAQMDGDSIISFIQDQLEGRPRIQIINVAGDHNFDLEIQTDGISWAESYRDVMLSIGEKVAPKGWRIISVEKVQRLMMSEPYELIELS